MTKVLRFLDEVSNFSTLQDKKRDLGKMMSCKALPQILWKAAWVTESANLDIPALKRQLESWGSFFRITVCKYKAEGESLNAISERQLLAKEVLASLSSVKKWEPKKLLTSPCFLKDTDTVENFEESLWQSLLLTSKGSQWLSASKLEKMVFLFFICLKCKA